MTINKPTTTSPTLCAVQIWSCSSQTTDKKTNNQDKKSWSNIFSYCSNHTEMWLLFSTLLVSKVFGRQSYYVLSCCWAWSFVMESSFSFPPKASTDLMHLPFNLTLSINPTDKHNPITWGQGNPEQGIVSFNSTDLVTQAKLPCPLIFVMSLKNAKELYYESNLFSMVTRYSHPECVCFPLGPSVSWVWCRFSGWSYNYMPGSTWDHCFTCTISSLCFKLLSFIL